MDQDYGQITLTQEDSDYVNLMIDRIGRPTSGYSIPNKDYSYDKFDRYIVYIGLAQISINFLGHIYNIEYSK